MNTPEIKQYIKNRSSLFWYIPENKKEDISNELLIETIFNYGSLADAKELFEVMGIEKVAKVFLGLEGRKKMNYYPEIYNFFSLILKQYAPEGTKSTAN
jgi:hypothetical protein